MSSYIVNNALGEQKFQKSPIPSSQDHRITNPAIKIVNEDKPLFNALVGENCERTFRALIDELDTFLGEARRSKGSKGELVFALQKIISKYGTLRQTDYKNSIGKFLASECEHLCYIHLRENDLRRLWTNG